MGQMTVGIMYGCKAELPKGKMWHGDSVEIGGKSVYQDGLLDAYKPGRGPAPELSELRHGSRVVGFWVAVGPDQIDVPVRLEAVAWSKPCKTPYDRAVRAWARFAAWCDGQGVKLGEPTLWLALTEEA